MALSVSLEDESAIEGPSQQRYHQRQPQEMAEVAGKVARWFGWRAA